MSAERNPEQGLFKHKGQRGEGITDEGISALEQIVGEERGRKRERRLKQEAGEKEEPPSAEEEKTYAERRELMERLIERASPEQLWGNAPGVHASKVPPELADTPLTPSEVKDIMKAQIEKRKLGEKLEKARAHASSEGAQSQLLALRKYKGLNILKKGFWKQNPIITERKRLKLLSNQVKKLSRGENVRTHAPVEYGSPQKRKTAMQYAGAAVFGTRPDNRITGKALYELLDHMDAAAEYEYPKMLRERERLELLNGSPEEAPRYQGITSPLVPKPAQRSWKPLRRREERGDPDALDAQEPRETASAESHSELFPYETFLTFLSAPPLPLDEAKRHYKEVEDGYFKGESTLEEFAYAQVAYVAAQCKDLNLSDAEKHAAYREVEDYIRETQRERTSGTPAEPQRPAAPVSSGPSKTRKRKEFFRGAVLVPLALVASEAGAVGYGIYQHFFEKNESNSRPQPGDQLKIRRFDPVDRRRPDSITPSQLSSASFETSVEDPNYLEKIRNRNQAFHEEHPGGLEPPTAP